MKEVLLLNQVPEKARRNRIEYLSNQVKNIDKEKENIFSSDEYQLTRQRYQEKINKIEADYVLVKILKKVTDKEQLVFLKSKKDQEIAKIEDERAKTDVYIKIAELDIEQRKISQEIDEIYSIIHKEELEIKIHTLESLDKEINDLIDSVFKKLDQEQETYLGPLIEFGMTPESALMSIKDTNPNAFSIITRLRDNLDKLEDVQRIFAEITTHNFNSKSNSLDFIKKQIELVKKNI